MTDLKVLQEQADKWLASTETFAKGAELLKSIDEQKKLRAEEQKLIADTDKAKVDAENGRRFWTTKVSSLAPMFAAIITGLTFGLTYLGQQRQANIASQQGEEQAWREALQKIDTSNRASAQAGALAMQSFFGSQYLKEARQVAALLAPGLHNPAAFDMLFDAMTKTTSQTTQGDLTDIARALSSRLRASYNSMPEASRKESTFAQFLVWPGRMNPTNDAALSEKLQYSESDTWELETVSHNLSNLWNRTAKPLDPASLDLRGIIFLDNNFRGIKGLANAEMDSTTGFYGQCLVDDIVDGRSKKDNVIVACTSQ